ncbi:hypothetical protein ES707_19958 [subsurface metagenome]
MEENTGELRILPGLQVLPGARPPIQQVAGHLQIFLTGQICMNTKFNHKHLMILTKGMVIIIQSPEGCPHLLTISVVRVQQSPYL